MSDHKYIIIEKQILHAIEEGKLKAGEQLPTEAELSRKFGFSRMTVNKALTHLAGQGFIMRIRGKGIFVRTNAVSRTIASDILSGHPFFSLSRKLLSYELVSPDHLSGNACYLQNKSIENIHHFKYLYLNENKPVATVSAYLFFDFFPEISVQAPNEAYYAFQKLCISDMRLQRKVSISAHIPSSEQKQALQLQNSAILKICVKSLFNGDEENCPVEYSEIIMNGDTFLYEFLVI